MKEVRKAVFPVAGMGNTFPAGDQGQSKEMLPIVDKTADPVCGGRSGSGRDHRHDLRYRSLQARHRGSFRQGLRTGNRARTQEQDRDAGVRP